MKRSLSLLALFIGFLGVFQPVSATELLDRARADYEFQLEKYRDLYVTYQTKKGQFEQSQTFKSQEELVAAAREMLIRRADVWWTYFQALRTEVVENKGLPEEDRAVLVSTLETEQLVLSEHKKAVEAATTRETLLAEAQTLNDLERQYEGLAYNALERLAYGRFGYLISQSEDLSSSLKAAAAVQIRDQQMKESRMRGFDEVTNLINETKEDVQTLYEELKPIAEARPDANDYTQRMNELKPSYERMERVQLLIREFSEGIEL